MPRGGHFAAFEEPELLAKDFLSFVEKLEKRDGITFYKRTEQKLNIIPLKEEPAKRWNKGTKDRRERASKGRTKTKTRERDKGRWQDYKRKANKN